MTRSRLLCLAALLVFASPLLAAIKPPAEKEKWLHVTSGEFRIFSNASARETKRIVSDLVSMREALGVATKLKVRGSVPVNVFIFRDTRSFSPYRDAVAQQKNSNLAGLFFGTDEAKFVILNAGIPTAERLVYHELTHYFVRNTATNPPLWFNEGIAEYYSTFSARKDAIDIGIPVPEHVRWLREQTPIPLRQLFAIDARSREYNETSRQGFFYAQSWALVHYLLVADDGAHRTKVGLFLGLVASGMPTEQAFQTAFKTTYEEMENALRLYLRKPTMQYIRYQTGELKIPEVSEPQPISRAELLTALGSMLTVYDSTLADAETFLSEAIRADPALASAHAQLGTLKMRMRDESAARAAYEKALSFGSTDPSVYLAYGGALLRAETTSENDVKRARELFTSAVQLDPSSPRALAGLGATYLVSGEDSAPGIAALEKSLKLAPSQEDVAYNLLQLYASAGRRADAQRIADTILSKSSDPIMVSFAAEAVLRADLTIAEKLMESGKASEAIALLERVQSETTSGPMKQHLEAMLSHARLQAQVERINIAIDHANRGRVRDAIKILDEVIPQMTDAEFKEQAEKLRSQWKKR